MLKKIPLSKLQNSEGCVVLLGGFDGLHIGHRRLLARAKTLNLSIGIMTIGGGKLSQSLFTFSERERMFSNLGIDFCLELPFQEIKDLSPESFISLLEENCNVKAFVCGEDFRFGAGALGDVNRLKEISSVPVYVEKLLYDGKEKVGSSLVKEYLRLGDVENGNRLLGERFFLTGKVVEDRKIGRTIGFPTANVLYPKEKFPLKLGVYETRVTVDGTTYKGITNYGARPTFSNDTILTETHLISYTGSLYGREITIEFVSWLREIQKFESVEGLKIQLEKDVRRVTEND